MAKELSQKLTAFKTLLKVVEEGSFDLCSTSGEPAYGYRSWPVGCFEPLRALRHSKTKTRQRALDETLMNLTKGDFPKTTAQIKKEQEMIRLTLLAGANPNYSDSYHGSVFDSFWYSHKGYGMAELVQDDRFESPKRLQDFYANFSWYPIYGFSDEEYQLGQLENENRAHLIQSLFQKNMYPTDMTIFKELSSIPLEKDPQFFEKKKEQAQRLLARARTPIQIYSALMGKRKEKN